MLPTIVPRRYPELSSYAMEFGNPEFIGDKIFPIIESETKDIRYGRLDKLNLFQNIDDTIAKDGEANEVGFGADLDYRMMHNYALKTTISREDTADGEQFLNVAMDQTAVMKAALGLRREVRQSGLLYQKLVAASRNTDNTSAHWSDYSGSAPDIVKQIRDLRNNALYPYTDLVIPKQVYIYLERAPSLLNQWYSGNTGTKILSKKEIGDTLGFDESKIHIPDGRLTTVRRPTAFTADMSSLSRIWGNHVFLMRVSPTVPNRSEPGCAYQFRRRWNKGVVGDNMQVRAWYLPNKGLGGADVVQQEYQALDVVLSTEMGYVLQNCV